MKAEEKVKIYSDLYKINQDFDAVDTLYSVNASCEVVLVTVQ